MPCPVFPSTRTACLRHSVLDSLQVKSHYAPPRLWKPHALKCASSYTHLDLLSDSSADSQHKSQPSWNVQTRFQPICVSGLPETRLLRSTSTDLPCDWDRALSIFFGHGLCSASRVFGGESLRMQAVCVAQNKKKPSCQVQPKRKPLCIATKRAEPDIHGPVQEARQGRRQETSLSLTKR